MKRRKHVPRRAFLKASGLAAGTPLLAGLPASSLANVAGANEFLELAWIGVGGRGTSLLDRALRSASTSRLKVAAVCDIDPTARRRAIERCGAMKPTGFHDYRHLLERENVDAVFVATPIHLHAEHATACLRAGKHVYCEKPLGRTPEEVKVVYDAVKETDGRFQVGFQWRYHAGFLGLVNIVQSGGIGRVSFVDAARHVGGYPTSGWYIDRNLSGDLIVEQAVHEMNIFCWMLASHPLRAAGFGGINALDGVPQGRTIMDAYAVSFEFPGDIRVSYSHNIYAPGGFGGLYQRVYGGRHRACVLEGTNRLFTTKDGTKSEVELTGIRRDATEAAIRSFAESLRNDTEPLADVDAGRHATLMAIMGRNAIHEGRVVSWDEVALEE